MSNFSFSLSVFYPFEELSVICIKFETVVCKVFQFEPVQNIIIWEAVVWLIQVVSDTGLTLNVFTKKYRPMLVSLILTTAKILAICKFSACQMTILQRDLVDCLRKIKSFWKYVEKGKKNDGKLSFWVQILP